MTRTLLLATLFSCASNVFAEPWIDTSNVYLKTNIQHLADEGHITVPVTTYPLMWQDIVKDLKNVSLSSLDQSSQNAYLDVMHQFKLAKRSQKKVELNVALKNNRFTSFGDSFREKNNMGISTTWMNNRFAGKLSTNYNFSNTIEKKVRYDGSYLSTFIGNWVATIGLQDRWWGPGWDSNLSLTNNARPMPALSLTRKTSAPFVVPFTDYNIPWNVTSFMGMMDDERIINDTLLWGFRLNFKPIKNLEIGLTRLAQWGGDGRPQNGETFWNVLIGKDNCGAGGLDCTAIQEPGNQQAGYDFRYTFNVIDLPMAFYGQSLAEDGNDNSSFSFLTEIRTQLGLDTRFNLYSVPTTLFLETANTYTDCVDEDTIDRGDCFYEHHIYQTGMRYNQRTVGHLYDNDAKTTVLGLISSIGSNTNAKLTLRRLELNIDNLDKAPNNPLIGNPLTKVAEDISMISTQVQHSYQNWRFTVGVDLSQSKFIDKSTKSTTNVYLNVEHNL